MRKNVDFILYSALTIFLSSVLLYLRTRLQLRTESLFVKHVCVKHSWLFAIDNNFSNIFSVQIIILLLWLPWKCLQFVQRRMPWGNGTAYLNLIKLRNVKRSSLSSLQMLSWILLDMKMGCLTQHVCIMD